MKKPTETEEQTVERLARTLPASALRRYVRVARWTACNLREKKASAHKIAYWDSLVDVYTLAACRASAPTT